MDSSITGLMDDFDASSYHGQGQAFGHHEHDFSMSDAQTLFDFSRPVVYNPELTYGQVPWELLPPPEVPKVGLWRVTEPFGDVGAPEERSNIGGICNGSTSPISSDFEADMDITSPQCTKNEYFSTRCTVGSEEEYLPVIRHSTRAKAFASSTSHAARSPKRTIKANDAHSRHASSSRADGSETAHYVIEKDDPTLPYIVLRNSRNKEIFKCRKPHCTISFAKSLGDMLHHLESLAHQTQSWPCPSPKCRVSPLTRKDAVKRHVKRQHPGAAGRLIPLISKLGN